MRSLVWKEARRRARSETLELLRLNSAPRAIFTLGTLLVAFLATLGMTGQVAIAALATAAWMVVCGLAIFVGKLINAPARIAAEALADTEALAVKFQSDEARKAKRVALGVLIEEASNLLDDLRGDADLEELIGRVADWRTRTLALLDEQFDPGYRARFMNSSGIVSGEPAGLEEERKSRWRWLNYRTIRLQQIQDSL
jgi:hypothetical protein